jgi:hypothetical protein
VIVQLLSFWENERWFVLVDPKHAVSGKRIPEDGGSLQPKRRFLWGLKPFR